MATAQEVEAHYRDIIGQLRDALDSATQSTAKLTADAIHGEPGDSKALKDVHLALTDALNLAKNVTGEPQGSPVPDTGEGADLSKLPAPPAVQVAGSATGGNA